MTPPPAISALLLVFGATAAVVAAPARHAAAAETRLDPGATAPMFTLPAINEGGDVPKRVRLDDLVGERARTPRKAVVVSFFATYCEPCKKELPVLQRLHRAATDAGLGVVVVSIDREQAAHDELAALVKQHALTFPVLVDRFNIAAKRYGVEKLPSVFVLDGAGTVRNVNVGYSGDIAAELVRQIETVLGAKVAFEAQAPAGGGSGGGTAAPPPPAAPPATPAKTPGKRP
jgi:peroxiredoxin